MAFVRESPEEISLRRRRLLQSIGGVLASLSVLGAKEAFDFAAAPNKEKESDFRFPNDAAQETPVVLLPEQKSAPPVPFEMRGGYVNDASHLNKTAVYGVV